jgi:hypothetical protein
MVKVYAENGELKVKGTFDFGYMGFYTDDQITCQENIKELKAHWNYLKENLDIANCTDDEIAEFVLDYINQMETKIRDNIGYINDSFLENIYEHMEGIGWEFWENNKEITIQEYMPEDPDFDTVFYESGLQDDQLLDCDTSKMGDYEINLRRQLPMFDWDKYLGSLIFHGMYFTLGYIGFELSDPYDQNILFHAVDKLDLTKFKFDSWDNM